MIKKKKIYICSPYSGDIEKNCANARIYGRNTIKKGYLPIIPHLVYPQILDDTNPKERIIGIDIGLQLLSECDELWLMEAKLTDGMKQEYDYAVKHDIPVRKVFFKETKGEKK